MDVSIWEVRDYIYNVIFNINFIVFVNWKYSFYFMQVFNLKKKVKKQGVCRDINMWGLYCWGDLNIYLILFWVSFENKNQSFTKVWR
jgi:hypothetical protein